MTALPLVNPEGQRRGEGANSSLVDPPPHPSSPSLTDDQSRTRELRRVVRDRRLTPAEWPFEVARADLAFGGDDREDPQADWISERGERVRQEIGLII